MARAKRSQWTDADVPRGLLNPILRLVRNRPDFPSCLDLILFRSLAGTRNSLKRTWILSDVPDRSRRSLQEQCWNGEKGGWIRNARCGDRRAYTYVRLTAPARSLCALFLFRGEAKGRDRPVSTCKHIVK